MQLPLPLPDSSLRSSAATCSLIQARLLLCAVQAIKPVLVCGAHMRSARARSAMIALAEASGYPVAVMVNSKGLFPEDHPNYIGGRGGGRWGVRLGGAVWERGWQGLGRALWQRQAGLSEMHRSPGHCAPSRGTPPRFPAPHSLPRPAPPPAGLFWASISTPYTGEVVVSSDAHLFAGPVSQGRPQAAGHGCAAAYTPAPAPHLQHHMPHAATTSHSTPCTHASPRLTAPPLQIFNDLSTAGFSLMIDPAATIDVGPDTGGRASLRQTSMPHAGSAHTCHARQRLDGRLWRQQRPSLPAPSVSSQDGAREAGNHR